MIDPMAIALKILLIILPLHGKPAHIKDIATPMSFMTAMKDSQLVVATPKGGPVQWTMMPAYDDALTSEMVSSVAGDASFKNLLKKSIPLDKLSGADYMFAFVVGSSEDAMKIPALNKFLKNFGKTGRPISFWGLP